MGEWAVGYRIVGVTSFQKIYGLYGLKHHMMEINGDVTMETNKQQKVKTELVSHSTAGLRDC